MSKNPASQIVDVSAGVADMGAYLFLGVAGAVTLDGYFLDSYNGQCSASFTSTVPAASAGVTDAVTFATLYGATLPLEAVGFSGKISAAVYISTGGRDATMAADMKTNPTRYPKKAQTDLLILGRVA